MPARLLVHGGTGFTERCRVGEWREIGAEVLEDKFGLAASLSFGCGLLNGEPILILRQLQNVENRGGYAFSLLLGPGEDVWSRFQWNVADLLRALMPTFSLASCHLASNPESVDESSLIRFIASLGPPPAVHSQDSTDLEGTLVALIAGSALEGTSQVSVAPQDVGLNSEPSPEDLIGPFSRVPPACRFGSGWLVGGGARQAEVFGARILCSRMATATDSRISQQLISRGRALLSAASSHGNRPVRDAVSIALQEPPVVRRTNGSALRSGLVALTGVLADEDDAILAAGWLNGTPGDGDTAAMKAAVIDALINVTSRTQRRLTPSETSLLVMSVPSGDAISSVAARMDAEAVVAHLVRVGCPLVPIPLTWSQQPAICLSVWRRFAQNDPVRLPAALMQRGESLAAALKEGNEAVLRELVHSHLDAGGSWKDWDRLHPELESGLRAVLRDAVRTRMAVGSADWTRAYLRFGEDSGGGYIAPRLEPREVVSLVTNVLSLTKSDTRNDALRWLDQLATSTARHGLPPDLVIRIASTADGNWTLFRRVLAAFEGGTRVGQPIGTDAEREEGLAWLRVLLKRDRLNQTPPSLTGLRHLFGDQLAVDVLRSIGALTPSLKDRQRTEEWLSGLKELALSEAHERESARDFEEQQVQTIEYLVRHRDQPDIVGKVSSRQLAEVFMALLFESRIVPADYGLDAIAAIGRAARHNVSLREAIEEGLIEARTASTLSAFTALWARDEQRLIRLLGELCDGLRPEIVARLLGALIENRAGAVQSVAGRVITATSHKNKISSLEYAFALALRGSLGTQPVREIETRWFGAGSGAILRVLDRILRLPESRR